MLNLKKIFNTKTDITERYVEIFYVNKNKDLVKEKIDLLSAKKDMENEDWSEIQKESLSRWVSDKENDFLCFFSDCSLVNLLDVDAVFLADNKDKLMPLNGELYIRDN